MKPDPLDDLIAKTKLKVSVSPYSSIVGGGVQFHEADGRFAGQLAFMSQTDTLRDKELQLALSNLIVAAVKQAMKGTPL